MRVQHNIASMNSYRNYNNNTKNINKNLEKLSSGYKINRAGDNAAGLAISEKMRAQITGLEGAQKNAKDGISLVQTAEGALTEVHSMLNRMYELAEQSANGTYDNTTDRAQLQKEVEKLTTEINRIADSSNFNGLNLLDGSLSTGGSGSTAGFPTVSGVVTETVAGTAYNGASATIWANVTDDAGSATAGFNTGDVLKWRIDFTDAQNKQHSVVLEATVAENGDLLNASGEKVGTGTAASTGTAKTYYTWANLTSAFSKIANSNSEFAQTFSMTSNGSVLAKEVGDYQNVYESAVNFSSSNATLTDSNLTDNAQTTAVAAGTAGTYAYEKADLSALATKEVFTVNGKKFAFVDTDADAGTLGQENVHTVKLATAGTVATGDVSAMNTLIQHETGYDGGNVSGTVLEFKRPTNGGAANGGGLTLQIGDTSATYNKMVVDIKDCHAGSIGIGGVSIADQSSAASAMADIKAAIDYVSDVRGTLGATQNRLEHTINNLSVMQENIQDAESTIRDTDVADEMMKYTKNSILVQSAQAMLAQANQQPQGVLQLLQ